MPTAYFKLPLPGNATGLLPCGLPHTSRPQATHPTPHIQKALLTYPQAFFPLAFKKRLKVTLQISRKASSSILPLALSPTPTSTPGIYQHCHIQCVLKQGQQRTQGPALWPWVCPGPPHTLPLSLPYDEHLPFASRGWWFRPTVEQQGAQLSSTEPMKPAASNASLPPLLFLIFTHVWISSSPPWWQLFL